MTISAQTFVSLVIIFTLFGAIQGACMYCIFLERKVCAWIQDRIGPNRVGPAGLLQSVADGIKLMFKEDYNPRNVDLTVFILAPAFIVIPALIGWAVVPWGGYWECPGYTFGSLLTVEAGRAFVGAANVNVGIVFVLATTAISVYGVVLGGWASNNKYSFLGGLRSTAQMVSYEIPLGVSILIVLLMAGSLRPDLIVQAQVDSMWFIVAQPIAALLFFTSALAEANRAPFDLAEAEQELVGGYHTEYAAMKWALFFLAEYSHMITSSAIFAALFLGGWHILPFIPQAETGGLLAVLIKMGVFVGKVAVLITLMMVIRWTLPRLRYDQLMALAWRGLIPLSVALLVGTALLIFLGYTQWWAMLALNILIGAGVWIIWPWLPRGAHTNRRIPLAGSRFSPLQPAP